MSGVLELSGDCDVEASASIAAIATTQKTRVIRTPMTRLKPVRDLTN